MTEQLFAIFENVHIADDQVYFMSSFPKNLRVRPGQVKKSHFKLKYWDWGPRTTEHNAFFFSKITPPYYIFPGQYYGLISREIILFLPLSLPLPPLHAGWGVQWPSSNFENKYINVNVNVKGHKHLKN